MEHQRTSETDKAREAFATRISGFPLIQSHPQRAQLEQAAKVQAPRRFIAAAALTLASLGAQAGGMDMNDSWTGADKTKHAAIGFAIGTGVATVTGRPMYGFVAGTAVGVLKEMADARSRGHHSSLQDLLVTAAGSAAGAYTGGLIVTHYRGRTTVQINKEF